VIAELKKYTVEDIMVVVGGNSVTGLSIHLMPGCCCFWSWNKISDAAIKILEILIGD
jgi:hypothetical protein